MKKYLYAALIAFAAVALCACTEDEGTEPGNDSVPTVTFYTYDAPSGTDADQTVSYRIVPNNKVSKMYILTETKADKEAYIASNGVDAYNDRVVASGTEYEAKDQDLVIENLVGLNTTTVVAVTSSGRKKAYENIFKGIVWVNAGRAMVFQNFAGDGSRYYSGYVTVQRQSDNNIVRVVNLFGQLNSALGSPTNRLTFSFNDKHACTGFETSRAPFIVIGFNDGAGGLWHGYYDTVNFGSYCSFEDGSDEDGKYVLVNTLKLNNNTGKLATGGQIIFYIDEIEWFK